MITSVLEIVDDTLTFASSSRPRALNKFPKSLRTPYNSCKRDRTQYLDKKDNEMKIAFTVHVTGHFVCQHYSSHKRDYYAHIWTERCIYVAPIGPSHIRVL